MPWLTPRQVVELTGYKQYQKQLEALNQMGIDHKKLTYRFNGRDFRLTDVKGEVLRDILA